MNLSMTLPLASLVFCVCKVTLTIKGINDDFKEGNKGINYLISDGRKMNYQMNYGPEMNYQTTSNAYVLIYSPYLCIVYCYLHNMMLSFD